MGRHGPDCDRLMLVNRALAVVLACAGIVWGLTAAYMVWVMVGCFPTEDCTPRVDEVVIFSTLGVVAALGCWILSGAVKDLWHAHTSAEHRATISRVTVVAIVFALWLGFCFVPEGPFGPSRV
jgi:hypothetical protein